MTLPHDAMIGLQRSARNGSGSGYFPGGVFEYNKTFDVPDLNRPSSVARRVRRRPWLLGNFEAQNQETPDGVVMTTG